MVTKYLWQRLPAIALTGLLLMGLILAACTNAAESEAEPPSSTEQTDAAAPTEATEEAETTQEAEATEETETNEEAEVAQQSEATEEAAVAQQPGASEASAPAVCEAVEIPVNEALPAVSEEDWTKGPATASVTVIEYGDFQ